MKALLFKNPNLIARAILQHSKQLYGFITNQKPHFTTPFRAGEMRF
jgi:hypothetical protein